MIEGWFRRRYMWYLKRNEVLKAHKSREGECVRCGACCEACIFHDGKNASCRIYRMRPDVCRAFPLTPHDQKTTPRCGFRFR